MMKREAFLLVVRSIRFKYLFASVSLLAMVILLISAPAKAQDLKQITTVNMIFMSVSGKMMVPGVNRLISVQK